MHFEVSFPVKDPLIPWMQANYRVAHQVVLKTCWNRNKCYISVYAPYTKTQLLFWFQQEVGNYLMGHPVRAFTAFAQKTKWHAKYVWRIPMQRKIQVERSVCRLTNMNIMWCGSILNAYSSSTNLDLWTKRENLPWRRCIGQGECDVLTANAFSDQSKSVGISQRHDKTKLEATSQEDKIVRTAVRCATNRYPSGQWARASQVEQAASRARATLWGRTGWLVLFTLADKKWPDVTIYLLNTIKLKNWVKVK